MSEDELVRELEDDMRRDHWNKLWRGFGSAMVGLSLLVIIATIAVVAWQHHAQELRIARTSQFLKGIERYRLEDYQGALAAFSSFSDTTEDDMSLLAKMWIGKVMIKMHQPERALAAYADVARNKDAHPLWGDLAAVLAVELQREYKLTEKVKETPPQPGAPFYFTAAEQSAVEAIEAGDHEKAVAQLSDLHNNPLAPASLRDRTDEMLNALGPVAAKPAAAPAEKPAAPDSAATPGN
jgi:hypothetical protein